MNELTPAEMRLYRLIVEEGLRDKQISKRIGYSLNSVKAIVHLILEKKGASSRIDLTIKHWRNSKDIERA